MDGSRCSHVDLYTRFKYVPFCFIILMAECGMPVSNAIAARCTHGFRFQVLSLSISSFVAIKRH